jgi:hypothetical protein
VVIAHRFSWALQHGVDALTTVPVLEHRCDTPVRQLVAPGQVEASSAWRNWQEWVMRRHTIGGPLRDARGARGRAHAERDALRADPSGEASSRDDERRVRRGPGAIAALGRLRNYAPGG